MTTEQKTAFDSWTKGKDVTELTVESAFEAGSNSRQSSIDSLTNSLKLADETVKALSLKIKPVVPAKQRGPGYY